MGSKLDRERARQDQALARMAKKSPDALDRFWEAPEDARLARLTYEISQRKGIKRRAVVGGGLVLLGALVLAAKGYINLDEETRDQQTRKEKERGQDAPTRLEVLEECRKWFPPKDGEPKPDESFLTFGGLGCVDSEFHARPMYIEGFSGQQEKTTPMSYLVASLEGKTIPEVADIIKAAAKESGSLSYYGQSNGSIVVLEALNYLKEEKKVIIPVNRFILNCSPFDFGDAKVNYVEEWLSKFLVGTSYSPGTLSQFLYLLRENWSIDRENLFDSFLKSIEKSWNRAQAGEPPGPWIADLRILIRSRLNEHNFEGILTKNTKMLFLQSDNDDVVYNSPAIGKFAGLAKKYGTEFTVKPLPPGTRHGDSEKGGIAAEPWVQIPKRRGVL